VVADQRKAREGSVVATLGHYNPRPKDAVIVVDKARTLAWLAKARSRATRSGRCSKRRVCSRWPRRPLAPEVPAEGAYLAVARFRKPHGLKGDAVLQALTDEPAAVFAPGEHLLRLDSDGNVVGDPLVIERGRWYHRYEWLVKFEGATRDELENVGPVVARCAAREASPAKARRDVRARDSRRHRRGERRGDRNRGRAGRHRCRAAAVVKAGAKEHLIPFQRPILVRLDRAARRIEVAPPPGLLEL